MKVNTNDMRHKILDEVRLRPEAVNSDKLLISLIWEKEGWAYNKGILWNLHHVSSPETIRRTRQKLVEEGLIKPCEETTEARYEDFKQARMAL